MSSDQETQNGPTCLVSVNRISKLPMVESTVQTGMDIYGKIKDYNSVTNWTMSTAENTVYKAVEVGKPYAAPVVSSLGGPIKKVDDILCSGLDYVESKVPAVKLPPTELYNSTKDLITNNSTVQTACAVVQPAVDTAKSTVQGAKTMIAPTIEIAKTMAEPAMQNAKKIVDPYVQSSMEKAAALRDYGTQKIEEFLHSNGPDEDGNSSSNSVECVDCQGDSQKH